jgi:hypothetical protein
MLESVANSQEAFIAISYANTLNEQSGYSVNLFTELVATPVIKPNCGIFPLEKALYAKDLVIATSISTGRYLQNCIAKTKVLYIWEPEWIFKQMDYIDTYKIINSTDIIICQSSSHDKCIKNIANRKSNYIIPNFNLVEMIREIRDRT